MADPVNPFQGGVFNRVKSGTPCAPVDHLDLMKNSDRLSLSVVIAVGDAADRGLDPGCGEVLGLFDGYALRSTDAVTDEAAPLGQLALVKHLFQGH